jgi:hypothetical protein
MLHPALARALATAQVEDRHRAAARWLTIRVARRARGTLGGHSTGDTAIRVDSVTSTAPAQADGMTPTEIPQADPWPCQSVVDVRLGPRAGVGRCGQTL